MNNFVLLWKRDLTKCCYYLKIRQIIDYFIKY